MGWERSPGASSSHPERGFVPVLMYHSVSYTTKVPRRFRVTPELFAAHLDLLLRRGYTTMTIGDLATVFDAASALPARTVALTFDDGFADFATWALPLLRTRGFTATLFVTTGLVEPRVVAPEIGRQLPGWGPMLTWSQLRDVHAKGVEIGGHTHTHPALDVLAPDQVDAEVRTCRALLGDRVDSPVRSFAYPYGYTTPEVARLVADAGYDVACGVKHAVSGAADDRLSLARVEVTSATSVDRLDRWLRGAGVRRAPCGDRLRTRAWRVVRHTHQRVARIGPNSTASQ